MHGSRGSHYRSRTCLNTHLGNCPGLDREYDYCTSKGDFSKEGIDFKYMPENRLECTHAAYLGESNDV